MLPRRWIVLSIKQMIVKKTFSDPLAYGKNLTLTTSVNAVGMCPGVGIRICIHICCQAAIKGHPHPGDLHINVTQPIKNSSSIASCTIRVIILQCFLCLQKWFNQLAPNRECPAQDLLFNCCCHYFHPGLPIMKIKSNLISICRMKGVYRIVWLKRSGRFGCIFYVL